MTAGKMVLLQRLLWPGSGKRSWTRLLKVTEGFHARDKVAVEDAGPEMSLDQLLALASNAQASEEGQGSKVEKEKEKDNASDSSSSSNTGSSEEEAEPLAMFGPSKKEQAQAKAKAATSSKSKSVQTGGALTAPQKSRAEMPPPGSNPTQNRAKAKETVEKAKSFESLDSAATLLADGRAQRALKNLQDKVAEWTAALANISFEDPPPAPDAQYQMAFKALCAKRVADLKNVQRLAKDYYKRMDKSTNKEAFADELSK